MFPLPTPDEMFSTLANGKSFSKLDLARAYKQMEVAENSQPFPIINTHWDYSATGNCLLGSHQPQ